MMSFKYPFMTIFIECNYSNYIYAFSNGNIFTLSFQVIPTNFTHIQSIHLSYFISMAHVATNQIFLLKALSKLNLNLTLVASESHYFFCCVTKR
jgi:hypothetical protein